jgi:hypothetical protein
MNVYQSKASLQYSAMLVWRVRYTLSGKTALSGLCCCRNCQRCTGSAFETVMVFPSENVSIQGELNQTSVNASSSATGRPVK